MSAIFTEGIDLLKRLRYSVFMENINAVQNAVQATKAVITDPRLECVAVMLNTESPDVMHHLARALVFIATTRRPVRYADQETH